MTAFAYIILTLGSLAFFYGAFLGFFKAGKRLRGWIIALVNLFVVIPLAGGIALHGLPNSRQLVAVVEPAAQEAISAATGKPSESEQPLSEAEAALSNPDALKAYCEVKPKWQDVWPAADAKFGMKDTPEKYDWGRKLEDDLTQTVTDAIGMPPAQWSKYASDHDWDHRCDALKRGWRQVELTDVNAADTTFRDRVKDAVKIYYEGRLNRDDGDFFFNKENFSSVECRTKNFGGLDFIGCRMRGGGFGGGRLDHSSTTFYLAAKLNDKPVVVPIDDTAEDHMKTGYLLDANSKPLLLGKYVGPFPLPNVVWAEVKSFFDK